jgi:MazG family protein
MKERTIDDLVALIRTLRGEGGCPWDRELTLGEVVSSIIEEAYELQWAHELRQDGETADELGDVLFLTVFAAVLLGEHAPDATIGTIAARSYDKIKRRHPHVFGDETAASREESIAHWNRVKAGENHAAPRGATALENLMSNLPPVRRAEDIQRAAARTGFDWEDATGILDKLREEIDEVGQVIQEGTRAEKQNEVGDLFFTVVNLARFLDIDSEHALAQANAKFIERFCTMETLIAAEGKALSSMTLEEMDVYWERAKDGESR